MSPFPPLPGGEGVTGPYQRDLLVEGGEAWEPPTRPVPGGSHHLAVTDGGGDDAPLRIAGAHGVVRVTPCQGWITSNVKYS